MKSAHAFVVCLVAVSVALALAIVLRRDPSLPEDRIAHRPIEVAQDGYVSSQTCKACHPDQYATWHASYHRTMTQAATPDTAATSFDGVTVDGVHGRPMHLQRRGAELWAEFDDPDASASVESRPRIERQVVMITGSHHQQVYWYATGQRRLLGQLPGVYLVREQRWIPRRAAVLHPPSDPPFSETGHWNSTCIACHATHGKPQFDTPFGSAPLQTQVVDTTVAEFGIACEMCHGPGAGHVATNRAPQRRYWLHLTGQADPSTVHPTRLKSRMSSQVCGQCHGVWEFYDGPGERQANSSGLPFRPGDELAKTRFVAQPTRNGDSPVMRALLADDAGFVRDSFWSDGMVKVSGREYNGLIESPCFKNAVDERRTLSCFSCHTMHKTHEDARPVREWADDQLGARMDGNGACVQCHEPLGAQLTAHTKHAAGSSGSTCYNCHMPYTSFGLLKTIRSHQISSPSVKESIETGRPNACNLCHLDRTLAWTSDYLERWYGTPKVTLGSDDTSIAASLQWLLRGDAGLRAVVAQAMAWGPAQAASGTDWMAPFLAPLLDDPYDAVRFVASRTLRALPGFASLEYDFVAPSAARRDAQRRTMSLWDRVRSGPNRRSDPQLLFDARGALRVDEMLRLLGGRNNRRILLRE